MFASSISKEELRELPTGHFKGRIHLIETEEQVEQACHILQNAHVMGFDTETRPSFTKGKTYHVALLQLSIETDAFLFRLNKIGLPVKVAQILSNPRQIKLGVAIHDDIRHLKVLKPFKPDGFIELQDYVKQYGIENNGLSKLAGIVLNFRISKSQQLTNWENETLSEPQQMYAATDAWAALEIYKALLNHQAVKV